MECKQCGKPMNPVEAMLGPVCGECVDRIVAEIAGKPEKQPANVWQTAQAWGAAPVTHQTPSLEELFDREGG